MERVGLYVHTIRYLKPIQVFGRIWFWVHRPVVRATHAPPVRKRAGRWRQSPPKPRSLLSPSRFRFLNEERELSSAADWNNPTWEKLWLYNLHYFDDLNAEGGEARSDWHRALIARWVVENPVGSGNGWEPYPLSLRIVNWIKWASAGNELSPAAVESLALQARFLSRRLEWHILGNHLLANAKALIFAGLFFEGMEAERWLAKGAAVFSRQLGEQVLGDGGHFERSPMYHAQVLEAVLDVVNALQTFPDLPSNNRGKHFLLSLQERCAETAGRMLRWLAVMTHPDGEIVLFNDAAFGDAATPERLAAYAAELSFQPSLMSFRPPFMSFRPKGEILKDDKGKARFLSRPDKSGLLRNDNGSAPLLRNDILERSSGGNQGAVPHFLHLADTGYIRVDCGDMAAFLDVAPIGPDYLPGHAHADTLSFELSAGTQRVIVDSGVSRYGEGPERLRQRGTAAHNTVEIDGQDSSEVWGGFRVARRAYPRDLRIQENPAAGKALPRLSEIENAAVASGNPAPAVIVTCAHDGYRRLPGKPMHRREWKFSADALRVHDTIKGDFREAVGRFYFHPAIKIMPASNDCTEGKIVLPEGREISWRIENGRGRLSETTWHPEFGVSLPNQCLEIHFIGGEATVDLSWK